MADALTMIIWKRKVWENLPAMRLRTIEGFPHLENAPWQKDTVAATTLITMMSVFGFGADMGDLGYYPTWMKNRPWTVKTTEWFRTHYKNGKLMLTVKKFSWTGYNKKKVEGLNDA